MKGKELSQRMRNLIFICCILAVSLLNQPVLKEGFQRTVRGLFVSYALIGIAIFWGVSAIQSIREKNSEKILKAIVIMIVFWLVLRCVKYEVWLDEMSMAIWYLFYIPQTFLPLLIFELTLHIDSSSKFSRLTGKHLYIPAFLISLGILTNNYHQLAFRFKDGIISEDSSYSYGPLYFISLAWMFILLFTAIINAARKSRLQNRKKATIILSLWVMVPILYIVYYATGPFCLRTYLLNFPEAMCSIYIGFLEICMQSGLINSNHYHNEIFKSASVMAEITNSDLEVFQKTDICPELSSKELQKTSEKQEILYDSYEMHFKELSGGRVYWLNDVKELLRVSNELKEASEELKEENNILQAEIEITERKAALEEKNKIYDSVILALKDKQALLLNTMEDSSQYTKALVIAAYMKRKGNLVILSRQEASSDIRELGLCINESFSYAKLDGCVCNCTISGSGELPAKDIALFYDVFEEVLEEAYTGLSAFLCYIRLEKGSFSMRFQLEGPSEMCIDENKVRTMCEIAGLGFETEKQDETLYLTFKKEVADE